MIGRGCDLTVLRLARPSALATAVVFEELFTEELGAVLRLHRTDSGAWWRAALGGMAPREAGSFDAAAARLDAQLERADFLAPDYEAAVFAPLFLALRNRARSRTRLLLVAHAPGAWALEWALMARLLAPGDRIVAPSRNAARLITFLAPALAPFVAVAPHPMTPLRRAPLDRATPASGEGVARAEADRIVSLGRIHPSKLLHRAIEALAVLRGRGRQLPLLEIAGAARSPEAATYLRSLQAKVCRLDLGRSVRFVGAVHGRASKARFLRGARALVNLSVTIEESFGKAPVEALGCGVPVLATRWNGLPETVGDGGVLVDVDASRAGVPADVAAEAVADGLERLLDAAPRAEVCRRQARRFAPPVALRRYRSALETAAAEATTGAFPEPADDNAPAAPERGLLAAAAPLVAMSWRDAFAAYLESCDDQLRAWECGEDPTVVRLRGILLQGTRAPIECFLAGRGAARVDAPTAAASTGDFLAQVAAGAASPSATPSTRVACLIHLWHAGRSDDLRRGLDRLDGFETPAVLALRAEEVSLAGDPRLAFDRAGRALELDRDDAVTAFRLRQLARIAREAEAPERALPWLEEWVKRFPDSPDSGPVWLDLAINAALAAEGDGERKLRAAIALDHARDLLGDSPAIVAVERLVLWAEAVAAVGD